MDQFLREFAYAIRTALNETTGKTPAELFLGRKLITPFQKLVMVSDGTEFAVGDIERLFEEARRNTKARHEKWEKYYNRNRGVMCKLRKCVETEIGTGSSRITVVYAMNRVVLTEYNGDQMSRKMVKKKKSEVKRELEEKGLSFKNDQGEKLTNKINKRGPLIKSIPSPWSEKSRMIKRSKNERLGYKRSHESRSGGPERKIKKGSEHREPKRDLSSNYRTNYNLPKFRKKSRKEETVTPTTSGYNLRPRNGKRVESRPTIERKTQQGGPVRSRKGSGRNDSPYIEERTRSSNKNARRGGDQQRLDQERKGAWKRKVLIGFAYCQWGAELLSLLCRPVCYLHSLSADINNGPMATCTGHSTAG
ncbi:uncharacterized protein TNCV_2018781 [Trichonephila clavipes]|nr:uncharacterized protein TNCV_2018781 [Trichonephila clavipes]